MNQAIARELDDLASTHNVLIVVPGNYEFPNVEDAPRTTGVHFYCPEALHETMKAICHARHITEGVAPKLSALYIEAVKRFIKTIDLRTGLPRKRKSRSA